MIVTLSNVVCFGLLVALCYVSYLYWQQWRRDQTPVDPQEVSNRVDAMEQTLERLKETERLCVDLRLCRPGYTARDIHLDWESSGLAHKARVKVDGSDATMLAAAESERKRLLKELHRQCVQFRRM